MVAAAAAIPNAEAFRRRELATFLRSRRAKVTPDQVGLRWSRHRRTPGLRREEVAQLAGVGITWYTWLEQGRDINPSPQVLEAISRALLLDPHERVHLFTLAGAADTTVADECDAVSNRVQELLDQLEPFPAVVVNGRFDILAFNSVWLSGFPHVQGLQLEDRNALWLMFTDEHWREVLLEWDDTASRMAAQYRAAMAEHVADREWEQLVARLHRASPAFAEIWARHDVQAPESRVKRFRHPRAGLLLLNYTYLWLEPRLGTRIVTYTPLDERTRTRLETLAAPLPSPSIAS
jgi:transcriptional regulator with XRE-family HTH domain